MESCWFLTWEIKIVGKTSKMYGTTWLSKEYPMLSFCCWELKKIKKLRWILMTWTSGASKRVYILFKPAQLQVKIFRLRFLHWLLSLTAKKEINQTRWVLLPRVPHLGLIGRKLQGSKSCLELWREQKKKCVVLHQVFI